MHPSSQQVEHCPGDDITKALSGVTLHYKTVYGEAPWYDQPCADGHMVGPAPGSAGEDKGHWPLVGRRDKWYANGSAGPIR